MSEQRKQNCLRRCSNSMRRRNNILTRCSNANIRIGKIRSPPLEIARRVETVRQVATAFEEIINAVAADIADQVPHYPYWNKQENACTQLETRLTALELDMSAIEVLLGRYGA